MNDQSLQHVKAVFMDWAGTMVDYGCFCPLDVFLEVFNKKGIEVSHEEAREPMGLPKRDHIKKICEMDRIANAWEKKYGRFPNEKDVDGLYADFEPALLSILPRYNTLIPGAAETAQWLQKNGIKIGSTTGYTREMMDIVVPSAKQQGYDPDSVVTSDEVPVGRPNPWMIFRNAMNLGVYPLSHTVKIGDTLNDINEGINAGTWVVGVVKGSSELGMTEKEVNECDPDILLEKMEAIKRRFKGAGADYVIESIGQLKEVIPKINLQISQLERGFV